MAKNQLPRRPVKHHISGAPSKVAVRDSTPARPWQPHEVYVEDTSMAANQCLQDELRRQYDAGSRKQRLKILRHAPPSASLHWDVSGYFEDEGQVVAPLVVGVHRACPLPKPQADFSPRSRLREGTIWPKQRFRYSRLEFRDFLRIAQRWSFEAHLWGFAPFLAKTLLTSRAACA